MLHLLTGNGILVIQKKILKQLTILYIPADRPIEFKLYSFGPITSFWIPQLGGQKYAMSDMVNNITFSS